MAYKYNNLLTDLRKHFSLFPWYFMFGLTSAFVINLLALQLTRNNQDWYNIPPEGYGILSTGLYIPVKNIIEIFSVTLSRGIVAAVIIVLSLNKKYITQFIRFYGLMVGISFSFILFGYKNIPMKGSYILGALFFEGLKNGLSIKTWDGSLFNIYSLSMILPLLSTIFTVLNKIWLLIRDRWLIKYINIGSRYIYDFFDTEEDK